jgi:hypothetical protein
LQRHDRNGATHQDAPVRLASISEYYRAGQTKDVSGFGYLLVNKAKVVSGFIYLLVEKCRFAVEEERSIIQEAKPDT